MNFKTISTLTAVAFAGGITSAAVAGAHTWRINEVFSTPDGLIQYIELRECCGGCCEFFVGGAPVTSSSNTFNFPGNLSGNTASASILLATNAYAALPGAPARDYAIPANFFNPAGDTITYSVYHSMTFGATPSDCVTSLHHDGIGGGLTGPTSPTNYSGATAPIDACPKRECLGDANNSGEVNIDDLVAVITSWGALGGPGDVNGSGLVNIDDLVMVITNWGGCP